MSAPQPRLSAKAPELGSFPLDHFRECKQEVEAYYRCLEQNDNVAPMCRDLVRAYLKCRMERGLMNKSDKDFGLPKTDFVPTRMHREDMRRDAARAGASAQLIGPLFEARFKSQDLKKEDGYEAVKGTTTPVNVDAMQQQQLLQQQQMNSSNKKQ